MNNDQKPQEVHLSAQPTVTYCEDSQYRVTIRVADQSVTLHSTTGDEHDFGVKLLQLAKMLDDARNAVLYLGTGKGRKPLQFSDRQWLQDQDPSNIRGSVEADAFSSATCAWSVYYDGPRIAVDFRIADCSDTVRYLSHASSKLAAEDANQYLDAEDQYAVDDLFGREVEFLNTFSRLVYATAARIVVKRRNVGHSTRLAARQAAMQGS